MQTIEELLMAADDALVNYTYYQRREILHQGKGYVKLRLYISRNLFVQINRNEIANLTNLVLLQDFNRIYSRDEYHGKWHRHPISDPDDHNHSDEGTKPVTLDEFLLEVDSILKEKGLV
ncbi:hypothetical protein L0Z72_07315 [candidate division KSB1 bacterium]|nr:hypothetical protein [candidate division KSB1 bacterium]